MSQPEHLIEIQRTMNAGAGDIYAAWTLPSLLNRWMTNHAESELRVGGAYRYEIAGAAGQTIVHQGKFLALEPGTLLRQTFSVEDGNENPFSQEFIELRLKPISTGRTELSFANGWEGPGLDEESFAAVRGAWEAWLDQLEYFLARVALSADREEGEGGPESELRVVRNFTADAATVFRAWTDPGLANRWLFSSGGERLVCELPARPGSRWVITERRDGVDYTAGGIYRRVEPGRFLSFSFGMPQFSPHEDEIEISFAEAGAVTAMIFRQVGPDIAEELSQVVPGAEGGSESGWRAMFDNLEKALAAHEESGA